jgi:hypothetical protein
MSAPATSSAHPYTARCPADVNDGLPGGLNSLKPLGRHRRRSNLRGLAHRKHLLADRISKGYLDDVCSARWSDRYQPRRDAVDNNRL